MHSRKAKSFIKGAYLFFPLTIRGLIILILSVYFISWPVILNSDIIAAGFAFCALATVALFASLGLLCRRRLKKSLKISLSIENTDSYDNQHIQRMSHKLTPVVIKVSGVEVPALYELRLKYTFEQPGISSGIHILNSSSAPEKFISELINFPHRGKWIFGSVQMMLVDKLGLTRISLPSFILNHLVTIYPEPYACPAWSLQASTFRSDDQINHPVDRRGDLYDIRQYHPSDGSRKIVWKMYAKSGQLFSRLPEPALTPEGKVAFFCLAGTEDDRLAAETFAYLSELENLSIEIIFSTLSSFPQIVESAQQARELLISEAWDSARASEDDAVNCLKQLVAAAQGNNQERAVQSVVLAVSESSLISAEYRKILEKCRNYLRDIGIIPVIFISHLSENTASDISRQKGQSLRNMIYNLIFEKNQGRERINLPADHKQYISSLAEADSNLIRS